ncbi:hypothetical protein [Streptacidiphilus carbonis]|nr:hypothetical protein [Streptacidiphilus carbonis]
MTVHQLFSVSSAMCGSGISSGFGSGISSGIGFGWAGVLDGG